MVWCVKALYLVTRGLSTKDLLSSGAKGQVVDFPGNNVDCVHKFHYLLYFNLFDSYFFLSESVVGLMRGELGSYFDVHTPYTFIHYKKYKTLCY